MRTVMLVAASLGVFCLHAHAGVIDPDCTAQKAAKSAAAKSTVGVGGRCSPKEAVTDTVGLDQKKDKVKDAKGNASDTTKAVKKVVP